MKKFFRFIFVLLLVAAIGTAGYLYMQNQDLNAQLAASNTQTLEDAASIASLTEANAILSAEIETLKADAVTAGEEIAALLESSAAAIDLQKQVDTLTFENEELQLHVDTLTEKNEEFADLVSDLSATITTLETEKTTLADKLNAIATYADEMLAGLPLVMAEENTEAIWDMWEKLVELAK